MCTKPDGEPTKMFGVLTDRPKCPKCGKHAVEERMHACLACDWMMPPEPVAAAMNKTYHFVTGMPRSGSTLLCNILAQNPAFAATGTSPLPALLQAAQQAWNTSPEAKANYRDADGLHLMRSIFEGYRVPPPQQVVFEKSRAWPAMIEMLKTLLGRNPKLIVCTRDVPSIVAWRRARKSTAASCRRCHASRRRPRT
jgi:hypothetical protein